jgi:hypothetical protein
MRLSIAQLKQSVNRKILNFTIKYMPFIYNRVTLTNNATSKKDGTGAQIQRVLAVASLAERLRVPFQQSSIIDVAVHPLDPFQDSESYGEFLNKLNFTFKLESDYQTKVVKKAIEIRDLKLLQLLRISVISHIKREDSLISVENPYKVSDLNPDDYVLTVAKLSNFHQMLGLMHEKTSVAIHYRQGVGNFAVYPGQSISREIEIEYFKERIAKYIPSDKLKEVEVHVYTDSPQQMVKYTPPPEQTYLWEGTPGFTNGVMEVQPLSFNSSTLGVKKVIVHSGGDPVDAILDMATSALLITGRSSLSYIAGLLNSDGIVVSAPQFWHPPLSHWK